VICWTYFRTGQGAPNVFRAGEGLLTNVIGQMRSVHGQLNGKMCALTAPFPICCEDYMTLKNDTMIPDLLADPFGERSQMIVRKHIQLLGGRFQFESNSPELLHLVDSAYLGLPRHRLSGRPATNESQIAAEPR